jgi:excisionase family DNA binding protein
MNPSTDPIFVKKTEAAKALRVSNRTLDNWVARRVIPYVAVSPRMHLFDLDEVKLALRDRFGVSADKR